MKQTATIVYLVMFVWERLLRRGNGWLFVLGWRRRSANMLDAAGAPMWLIRLRCPGRKGWGSVLYMLTRQEAAGDDQSRQNAHHRVFYSNEYGRLPN